MKIFSLIALCLLLSSCQTMGLALQGMGNGMQQNAYRQQQAIQNQQHGIVSCNNGGFGYTQCGY